MITEWFLDLVDSWLVGMAEIFPTIEFDQAPYGETGAGNWIGAIVRYLAAFEDWGVPSGTLIQILYLIITMEIAYGTVVLVTWTFNRVRGA